MTTTPFDDAPIEGEEETPGNVIGADDLGSGPLRQAVNYEEQRSRNSLELGITAEQTHARRKQECDEGTKHYFIQGACWYCDKTQRQLDEVDDLADRGMVPARIQGSSARRPTDCVKSPTGLHSVINGACQWCARTPAAIDARATAVIINTEDLVGPAVMSIEPPSDAAPAASSGAGQPRAAGEGHEQVGVKLASALPRTALGQFASRGAVPKPDHLISGAATRRARRRMQKIIDKGTVEEALAAYKLLYGQPPSKKGKATLPPSARQAPGVELPQPRELDYGQTG